jgi:hypothetical protein
MFESLKTKKRSVILDTDIGPDCDDAGAIAVLFDYARKTGTEVLGICNCTSNRYGTATVDALREFCGYPEFLLGAYSKPGFFDSDQDCNIKYNKYIAENFSEKFNAGALEYLPHVSFYRSLLADAEDDSVIIITIGMFNAFADFLKSGPDKYSQLTGMELADKKIHALVSMATELPQGREFNIVSDFEASKFCVENFPKPIYMSDAKLGRTVKTGFGSIEEFGLSGNPLVDSYRLYTNLGKKASFDLTAVQFAFEGEGELYSLSAPGRLEFYNAAPDRLPNADATRFVEDVNGNIRFMIKNVSDEMVAESLQNILDKFV